MCVWETGSHSHMNKVRITPVLKLRGEWSQGPWPWAWTYLLSILYSFPLLLPLSPPSPFCYVQSPYSCTWKKLCWFLWSLVRFTCANKKGLLTCKLCLGQYQQRIKASPGLSQESGIWLLPLGEKKGGSREPLSWRFFPEHGHQELPALAISL